MNILKNKNFWYITVLCFIGLWLRLIFINKPDGLWNDEYVSWSISILPFGKNFFAGILSQCHMPFYYFYLKIFTFFFGNSDTVLRLSSVIPGIISIPAMYFLGKELKNENVGILSATITTLSAFLIYFSQEVRFYEILFLFSAITIFYTLRLLKKQSISNLCGYIIFSFLVIFTHTIGIIFVFFNLIFVAFMLKSKKNFAPICISLAIITAILFPLIVTISSAHPLSQWWSNFNFSKILFTLTDFLSPVLTNIVDAPENFFANLSYTFLFFGILPSIIAIFAIYKAVSAKKNEVNGLLISAFCAVFCVIILAILGKIVFATKYMIEIYPILIISFAFGFLEIKNNILRKMLILFYCLILLFYTALNPNSAPKMHRSEGNKIATNLIKNAKLSQGDFILINYYPKNRFTKYFDFGNFNVITIDKGSFINYFSKQDCLTDIKTSNTKVFEQEFNKNVISKMKYGQKLTIINLKSVTPYSPIKLITFVQNGTLQNKPMLFSAFSYIKNQELIYCLQKLQIQRIETKGRWEAYTFIKP